MRNASRFLDEIPAEDLEVREERRTLQPRTFEKAFEGEPEEEETTALKRGRRVRHPRYGYGVILSQEGSGDETRLTVYFDRAGKKKFIARYADLQPA